MAPDNIFNDRDYFDEKFQNIDDKQNGINKRLDDHLESHKEQKANWYKLAGLVLTAAGVIATIMARF